MTTVEDIEVFADAFDLDRAVQIYETHGALVVRGLMRPFLADIARDISEGCETAISLLDQAQRIDEGWVTPDGTLFIPAPKNYDRDKQIMVLGVGYQTSAAFFRSAFEPRILEILERVLGPDVELFLNGQCLVKEPVGGHAKNLHQDSAYFEHRFEGPLAILSYVVDTDLVNGALYVVPGSHRLGQLNHIDTDSHLGLDETEWPWEAGLPIVGQAGDAIFFHYRTIHGSQTNQSNAPRPVFIHRYRAANDYVVISAASAAKRAEAEKHAAEAKKENQRGLMVLGRRAHDSRPT
jgi:hypothetical protein